MLNRLLSIGPRTSIEIQRENETDRAYATRLLELYQRYKPFEESADSRERALFAYARSSAASFRARFNVPVGQAAMMTDEQLKAASQGRQRAALEAHRDGQKRETVASRAVGVMGGGRKTRLRAFTA